MPPGDVEPMNRKNVTIEPISGVLAHLKDYVEQIEYKPTESIQQKQQREKKEKQKKQRLKLEQDLANWNVENDPQIRGNPYRTLFVGRLSYDVTEVELQKEFGKYGSIERIRVVKDKTSNKSKGYAFVLFERERDLAVACKDAKGKVINGRAIIVDVERGRTVKNWKPRRLGGGVGGRNSGLRRFQKPDTRFSGPRREYSRVERNYHSRDRDRAGDRERDRDRDREVSYRERYTRAPKAY